jgi:energy-coupling factor transport system permease protein
MALGDRNVILRREPDERQLDGPLGRLSPLTKLGIAIGWLLGLATTTSIAPPLAVAALAAAFGVAFGRLRLGGIVRGAAVLWVAALSVGLFNTLFAAANVDPTVTELARVGPLRLTGPGILGGIGLTARIVAIAIIGVVFAQTTDSTRLVDSLVQQAKLPERFAYGALAAYQAIPRLSLDLTTLRQARRVRGLPRSWHPRLLVSLLVLAIRHADRLALAMDARGFGSGPRSRYRIVRWGSADAVAAVVGVAGLAAALTLGR